MAIDTQDALRAHRNLTFIADRWTDLRARLRPGGGNALTGVAISGGGPERPSPIDLFVSDLMHEIEDEARMLGHVLIDETDDWTPRSSRMPVLLYDVAARYGHWTAGDERTALAFCDWAEEYAEKVRRALERPAPPEYVGPCQHRAQDGAGCGGELYLREGRDKGTCRECGEEFTREGQTEFVLRELQTRLMTAAEIVRGLKIVERPRAMRTVREWIEGGLLVEAVEDTGLYRFAEAIELTERPRGRRRVAA